MNSNSNYYQLYINQTLQLAETIVIKSTPTAETLNQWVYGISGGLIPISSDPTTWKYYLNLAGKYHPVDQMMRVISMDTQGEIIFNRENLLIHLATARAYEYGTRAYIDLVGRYPDQEQLILGILYPTDIHTAIAAADGQILSYPATYVESNERSLIPKLQEWINIYKEHRTIQGFHLTDELYTATNLGIMYQMLVPAILNLRLGACNTNEAHSFHVRQYLGSHGFLDEYVDSLTLDQSLYFYRNIAYIERNAGKRDTFSVLTDHIMTARRVPLAEYTMRHDIGEQPTEDYPEVIFRKKQLNLGVVLDPDNKIDLPFMLEKQATLARGNTQDITEVTATIKSSMENSPSNVVATKTLESSMVDESNSSPWILSEILFNHWMYLSSLDIYVAYINIINPIDGKTLPLTVKEAFVLAMYTFSRSNEEEPVTIPKLVASRVQRIPTYYDPVGPSVDDIYSIVERRLVPRSLAVQALSIQPRIETLISTEAFYSLGVSINNACQLQRSLIANQEHFEARGQVQAMVTRIYQDIELEFADEGTTYASWLSDRNIDLSSFSREDHAAMFLDLVGQATGAALHQKQTLKQMQTALVGMFSQLSSYGIQIIAEINDTNIRKTDWPGVRVGDIRNDIAARYLQPENRASIEDSRSSVTQVIEVELNHPGVGPRFNMTTTQQFPISTNLDTWAGKRPDVMKITVMLPKIRVTPVTMINGVPRPRTPVLAMDNYLNLPSRQQQDFLDIYNNFSPNLSGLIPLRIAIPITELLPFDWGGAAELLSRSIRNTILGKTWPES